MAGALTHLLYHIVFSTKRRARLIAPDWESDLHAYLGGLVKTEGGVPIEINGTEDHVHLLARLRPTRAISDGLRVLKANSSGWVNKRASTLGATFQWQRGYGAFTVSESAVEAVREYIRRQDEHHKTVTFEDEFRKLLALHGVAFDPKYLWDD